jgi:hypothetical protein
MATTTKTADFLGRTLITPGSAAKDYLGRDCLAGDKDFMGQWLAPVGAHPAAISPVTGVQAGGTAVTITGTNFTGATAASIGGTNITSFVVVNDSTITGVSAAHAAGLVNVIVVHANGNGTATGVFTYV